jgi:hypothetical protein
MTCAMRLHDPCSARVRRERLFLTSDGTWIRAPLCGRHVRRWDNRGVPFRHLDAAGREEWARWADERARRQEGRAA